VDDKTLRVRFGGAPIRRSVPDVDVDVVVVLVDPGTSTETDRPGGARQRGEQRGGLVVIEVSSSSSSSSSSSATTMVGEFVKEDVLAVAGR
jgi:hypothetical protein